MKGMKHLDFDDMGMVHLEKDIIRIFLRNICLKDRLRIPVGDFVKPMELQRQDVREGVDEGPVPVKPVHLNAFFGFRVVPVLQKTPSRLIEEPLLSGIGGVPVIIDDLSDATYHVEVFTAEKHAVFIEVVDEA